VRAQAFRLASVLKLRRHQLDAAARELAARRRAVERAARELQRPQGRALREHLRLGEWIASGVAAGRYHAGSAGVARLAERARQVGNELERSREQAERSRQALLAARTRVRALERLRERAARHWRWQEQRAEQRELDEVGQRRWEGRA